MMQSKTIASSGVNVAVLRNSQVRRSLVYRAPFWFIALIAALWSVASHAFVVSIDEFSIIRNDVAIFTDTFSDDNEPPSAPNFASGNTASYNVFGTIPNTAESGGVLLLDTANGALSANALELARIAVRVRLLTDITDNLTLGLKSDDTLLLTGIFSLTTPTGVLNPQYSIRFNDASGGEGADQILQLQVSFRTETGETLIRYILQDFEANTITVLEEVVFAPPDGADQILLSISRPDADSDNFFGSFSYLDGGAVVGGGAFATPGQMFQGEDFVRAEFNIADGFVAAVPEPGSLALLGLGLLGLGWSRRKKA